MTDTLDAGPDTAEQTPWTSRLTLPLRAFQRTETASAGVLAGAIGVALVWANLGPGYEDLWGTELSLRLGNLVIEQDLREWLNSGLITCSSSSSGPGAPRVRPRGAARPQRFLCRRGRRAGHAAAGDALPGGHARHRCRVRLGRRDVDGHRTCARLPVGPRSRPARPVRASCSPCWSSTTSSRWPSSLASTAARSRGARRSWRSLCRGLPCNPSLRRRRPARLRSDGGGDLGRAAASGVARRGRADDRPGRLGVHPSWDTLERASSHFREFREEPTAELARTASVGLTAALSPNARLQPFYLPWTSYVIVPLFALANAGFVIDRAFLERAAQSPVTWGIVLGYVVGKPVGIVTGTWLVTRLSAGRIRSPLGWAALAGSGTIAGTGFTVSPLIATLAFRGDVLAEAKAGCSSPRPRRSRSRRVLPTDPADAAGAPGTGAARPGRAAGRPAVPVDPERDHIRGSLQGRVTLVEYGDFECPHCGEAEAAAREGSRPITLRPALRLAAPSPGRRAPACPARCRPRRRRWPPRRPPSGRCTTCCSTGRTT